MGHSGVQVQDLAHVFFLPPPTICHIQEKRNESSSSSFFSFPPLIFSVVVTPIRDTTTREEGNFQLVLLTKTRILHSCTHGWRKGIQRSGAKLKKGTQWGKTMEAVKMAA